MRRAKKKKGLVIVNTGSGKGKTTAAMGVLFRAWGRDIYVETRTVDVHIRRLRKALNAEGEPDLIRTVRGAGYAIDAEAP